jgi:hypothetical protein
MAARPSRSNAKKLIASLGVLAGVGAFVSLGAFSAFTSSVSNSSNLGSANIALTNTPSGILIDLADIIPKDLITRCIAVQNTGSIASEVALTKTTGGDANLLAAMLVSVEEGTVQGGSTPDSSCTGFVSNGGGAVYRMGTSAISTAGNFSGGVAPGSLTTENYSGWAANATKYFQIKVALPPNVSNAVKNLSSTLQFTWTASSPTGNLNR